MSCFFRENVGIFQTKQKTFLNEKNILQLPSTCSKSKPNSLFFSTVCLSVLVFWPLVHFYASCSPVFDLFYYLNAQSNKLSTCFAGLFATRKFTSLLLCFLLVISWQKKIGFGWDSQTKKCSDRCN